MKRLVMLAAFSCGLWISAVSNRALGQEYPPFAQVVQGYEQVTSTTDGNPGLYTIWIRRTDGKVLAEIPPDYPSRRYFIALTVAAGDPYAGLQQGDLYVYWRAYDKRLALIEPQIRIRSTGDPESQDSVRRLFTDRVLLEAPILTMGPRGGPIIDMGALLVSQTGRFFGFNAQINNPGLVSIKTAKSFPQNAELAFEGPVYDGTLKSLHYSISAIPDGTGYQPRPADQRVGYFTTSYNDLGKFAETGTMVRYINRWHLEKRDPGLKMSPPKNPLVFYIEHSTPVRYRRWIKQGILYWNAAFEKVGLREAIQVLQQDAVTREHMDKDPEDVRYNFVRWLSNDIGTAIGPSRVNPLTGEILDADIILTDGWIRHYMFQRTDLLTGIAMDGMGPETLEWLENHPNWDPRLLLAPAAERDNILTERARNRAKPYGGHALANVDHKLLGDDEFDGLVGRTSQCNGMCMAAHGLAFEVAKLRMSLDLMDLPTPAGDEAGDVLDGMPEEYVGPLVAELTAHEVGHTLGLRHNFKSSSIYTIADINSEKVKGKPFAGSVMDYLPINMATKDGVPQGDFAMLGIGPYDMWAIEYGYTQSQDLAPILARVAEPELQFATDEDTYGPDPLAKRYDFGSDPLSYARSQMELAQSHRLKTLDKYVKDGESWAKARRGYELTLGIQMSSLNMMSDWLGGAFVHRDKKGDKDGRPPVVVVPAVAQREALKFVIDNCFPDSAYGLTPDLLRHLATETWLDGDFFSFSEPTWPVHERIMGIQSTVLTFLLNPNTLKLVFDNELRTPPDEDVLTLPELLDTVSAAIWSDLDQPAPAGVTARKPWISSLRRNLQREHLQRLIDLTLPDDGFGAAHKPISNLAMMKLRAIKVPIAKALENAAAIDPYTVAHLTESQTQIDKALDAQYIYNIKDGLGGGGQFFPFFNEEKQAPGK